MNVIVVCSYFIILILIFLGDGPSTGCSPPPGYAQPSGVGYPQGDKYYKLYTSESKTYMAAKAICAQDQVCILRAVQMNYD